MPSVNNWVTPTLSQVRQQNLAYIQGALDVTLIPNSIPTVLAEANAGNAHLNLQYLDTQSQQFLPLTATGVFLDKLGAIYLVNSDGSRGRKVATYASGEVSMQASVDGTVLPAGSQLTALSGGAQIVFETIEQASISTASTSFAVRSLTEGAVGNLPAGTSLTLTAAIPGLQAGSAVVVATLAGGADTETDDELRARILNRIQNPPMGGDANDWESWCLSVAGVTRAWCSPNEMAPGTVTIRIMCDDLRATSDPMTSGLPTADDIQAVRDYLETVRPVTVSEYFVLAPIPVPVNFTVTNLSKESPSTRAAISSAVASMIAAKARPARAVNGTTQPAQTIYSAWVSDAVFSASGVRYFDLQMADFVPPNNGCIAVMGTLS